MYAKRRQWFLKSKKVLKLLSWLAVVWKNPVVLIHSCAVLPQAGRPGLCPSHCSLCTAAEPAEGHGWELLPHLFLCGFVTFILSAACSSPTCCCSKLQRPEGKRPWITKKHISGAQPCSACWQPLALRIFWSLHYPCASCYGWLQVKESSQRPDHTPSPALVMETQSGDKNCKKSTWAWGFSSELSCPKGTAGHKGTKGRRL